MPATITQKRSAIFVILTILCIVLDLASKSVVFRYLPEDAQTVKVISWFYPEDALKYDPYLQGHANVEDVPGFFSLRHVENPGAVWGILPGQRALLIFISVVAIFFVFWLFMRLIQRSIFNTLGLALILGGALGNLFDRIVYEKVRDFLHFMVFWTGDPVKIPFTNRYLLTTYEWNIWPTFNMADVFLCVGVFLLAGLTLFEKEEEPAK